MPPHLFGLVLFALLGIATAPLMQAADRKGATNNHEAYDDEEIAKAASDFLSTGAKGRNAMVFHSRRCASVSAGGRVSP